MSKWLVRKVNRGWFSQRTQWTVSLVGGNNEFVLGSTETYNNKSDALHAIELAQTTTEIEVQDNTSGTGVTNG